MIEKITDQNLERYDSRLKEWCDRKFFEKGNYGKYQTTEEAGAVAFYPAPNTPLEGKVKFSFKETMPASGDKSPDNPSVIEGVSSIKVMHCGKNLAYPRSGLTTETVSDVTYTVNSDGTYTVNGTASGNSTFYSRFSNNYTGILLKNGSTYSLSGCPSGGSISKYFLHTNFSPAGYRYRDYGNGVSFTFNLLSKQTMNIAITIAEDYAASNLIFKPQLELGTIATEFEKPVYNEYIISLGNTYYGGTVDLSTGLMTVTWGGNVFDGTENWENDSPTTETVNVFKLRNSPLIPMSGIASSSTRICSHFTFSIANPPVKNTFSTWAQDPRVFICRDVSETADVAALKTWLATQYANNTPVTVVYELATPVIIQLSSTLILSLVQIDKYTPRINTIYTDADSVQISYLKSPIRDEYEKTQAILSLGGNS